MDFARRQITLDEAEVHLTPIEYKIIVLLAKNAGRVLTHDAIMREAWGPYVNEIRSLRVNMANIRRKLGQNPVGPRYIRTEVGAGYRMAE